jgi:hypothetical protein
MRHLPFQRRLAPFESDAKAKSIGQPPHGPFHGTDQQTSRVPEYSLSSPFNSPDSRWVHQTFLIYTDKVVYAIPGVVIVSRCGKVSPMGSEQYVFHRTSAVSQGLR